MSGWREEKEAVLRAALTMVEKGLVVGESGNVSMRLPGEGGKDLLAITPSRREYASLSVDDIQVVDFEAEPVEGDLIPSVETLLHAGIYRARKNIRAVLHTHSVFASVIAVAGMSIPPILEDQVNFLGGEIELAGYAMSGSDELVENVVAALGERNAALLPNHGAVGIGRTMAEALTVCELLEKTAKIYFCSLALGRANPLPDEALEAHRAFFRMLHSGEA
jgi:L-fuculose-phosphate aldolase